MRITCRIKMKDRKCSLAFLFTFYEYVSSKLCGSFAAYCFDLFLIYPGFHAINRVRVGPCTRRCLCILIQKFNISTHRSGQLALFCTLNMVAWKTHLNSLKGGSYSRIIKIFDDLSVAYQSIQFRFGSWRTTFSVTGRSYLCLLWRRISLGIFILKRSQLQNTSNVDTVIRSWCPLLMLVNSLMGFTTLGN